MSHLKQAEQAFHARDFEKAEKLIILSLQKEKTPQAYYLLGQLYYEKNQFSHAIAAFKKTLVLDPHFVDASISLSVIYNDLGHYEEGGFIFNRALRSVETHDKGTDPFLNDQLSAKHVELAEAYMKFLRYAEAETQLKSALKLKPNDPDALLHLAKVLFKQGKKEEALVILRNLKKEQPKFIQARIALGLLSYSMGHVLQAVEEWERVVEIEPNQEQALAYLKMARNSNATVLI